MFDFMPDQQDVVMDVPYFEDVTSAGWKGHTTRKTIDVLKSEVMVALGRLDGTVISFQRGTFSVNGTQRNGFRIRYVIEDSGAAGCIDIAALPVRKDTHAEQSLKMALFMLRDALDGMRFLRILSPGYVPLVPWMLARDDKTVSQLWIEAASSIQMLPESSIFDGEIV